MARPCRPLQDMLKHKNCKTLRQMRRCLLPRRSDIMKVDSSWCLDESFLEHGEDLLMQLLEARTLAILPTDATGNNLHDAVRKLEELQADPQLTGLLSQWQKVGATLQIVRELSNGTAPSPGLMQDSFYATVLGRLQHFYRVEGLSGKDAVEVTMKKAQEWRATGVFGLPVVEELVRVLPFRWLLTSEQVAELYFALDTAVHT